MSKLLGGWIEFIVRSTFEGPLGQLSRFFRHDYNVIDIVYRRAAERSALFVETYMKDAVACRSKKLLWKLAINETNGRSNWMEFGVFKGRSINYLSKHCDTIHGFDSFDGLAENWAGNSMVKGDFSLRGKLPRVNSNVVLIKGYFHNTLEMFLADNKIKKVELVHLDCDTYESTVYVLDSLSHLFRDETVIIFDDFFGAPGFEQGQYRALFQFVDKNKKLSVSYLGYSRQAVVVKLHEKT